MQSRERVRTALSHREPDQIPVSLGTNIVDGFTLRAKESYERFLGRAPSPVVITHKAMGTVATPESILADLGVDFRTVRLKAPWNNPSIVNEDGSYLDDYGVLMKPCEYYYDAVSRPLAGAVCEKDIARSTWPDPFAEGRTDGLREEAKALAASPYAVVADIMCGGPFEQALWLRGWEDFLCDLYSAPALAEALLDRITEIDLGLWQVFLDAVGEVVDVVCQGDDLGMQDRPIIPPELYRQYILKYHRKLYDFIHSRTKAKIFHHSCGAVFDLIPGLIEAGIDVLNPVQTSAKGMDPIALKREYGKDIVFWGGLDTQRILPYGKPADVEDEVRRLMEILGKDGGYVFAPGHNIQALVPAVNVHAMVTAVVEHRGS